MSSLLIIDIGDKFHYIMSCNYLKQEREKYLPSHCCNNVNTFKFKEFFSSCNVIVLEKLCKFIKIVDESPTSWLM